MCPGRRRGMRHHSPMPTCQATLSGVSIADLLQADSSGKSHPFHSSLRHAPIRRIAHAQRIRDAALCR
jgi:hypothetical protein